MIRVDIACDLMDGNETGSVWTFLREARDPSLLEPGAIVVAGDADSPAVAEVIDVVDKPAGKVVHLRVLPGVVEDCEALVRRATTRPQTGALPCSTQPSSCGLMTARSTSLA